MGKVLNELAYCYQSMNKKDEMLAAFKILADKYPTTPFAADAFFYLGEDLYAKKEYEKALAQYLSCLNATKDDSRKATALYRVGWCYWLLGKYDDAGRSSTR